MVRSHVQRGEQLHIRELYDVADHRLAIFGILESVYPETSAKSVTENVKKWKLMGIGALGVVGIGGTALGVSLANSFEMACEVVS